MLEENTLENKKAQIWVETVIYTIIGLAIIGIILAVARPAISKYKDEIILEQTITALNELHGEILEVRNWGSGNKRNRKLTIKKGSLIIDCQNELIVYLLEKSGLEYTEIGVNVLSGDLIIRTDEIGRKYNIKITINYTDINLTCHGRDDVKTLTQAPTPYNLFIENVGITSDKVQIDIQGD